MELFIGTAQFGFKYGFNKIKIKKLEIKNIEKILKRNSLKNFDTAMNYGESEKIIGNLIKVVGIVMTVTILTQIFSRAFMKVPFSWT